MINSQAPVSSLFYPSSLSTSSNKLEYIVISQNNDMVIVSNSLCSSLFVGEVLEFNNEAKGIVVLVENDKATVKLTNTDSVKTATVLEWGVFNNKPRTKLYLRIETIGSLSVMCSNTTTEISGYVGWTLLNGKKEVIAIGNDLEIHNLCYFEGRGLWEPDIYTLEVRSFTTNTLQPIKYGSKQWVVTTPATILGAGNGNNYDGTLVLI